MKNIVVFLFCLVTADIVGQHQLTPVCYLNGDEIDVESVYINPSSINGVEVDKKTERGKVYMKTKQPLTFMTLDMILKKYSDIEDSASQVVYIINDKVVTDKSKVKVDDSFFIQVEIKRLDRLNYINEGYRNLILADIQLLNEKPEPVIRIRGDETVQIRNDKNSDE
jgi:hypothetical protein